MLNWKPASRARPLSRRTAVLFSSVVLLTLAACATPSRLEPVPATATIAAQPLGLSNARFFPAEQPAEMMQEASAAVERQRKALGLAPDAPLPPAQFLSLSGGGDDGAFGAGLMVGWTEAGNRPEFEFVTGVSTGALIAPFAFLGPKYDPQLRAIFTTVSKKDIFTDRGIFGVLWEDAMSDTSPLWHMLSRYVDEPLMAALAEEYRKGRLLLIGTTNLDAQEPCLWNIGAIAASGQPGALDLIRKILRASSAIPAYFQPVLIDIAMDGKKYQELHVDGGATAQMFLYPPAVNLRNAPARDRTAYLIRNARENSEWAATRPRTLSIAGRAISTMIKYSGKNDMLRIYNTTERDGVDYNLAYIGKDFSAPGAGNFDKQYMNSLFDYAYQASRQGYAWKKTPGSITSAEPRPGK
jgi:predicted acylesterase/phospholipase RssA